jgi:hypothetical protein
MGMELGREPPRESRFGERIGEGSLVLLGGFGYMIVEEYVVGVGVEQGIEVFGILCVQLGRTNFLCVD